MPKMKMEDTKRKIEKENLSLITAIDEKRERERYLEIFK